jgi:hypothetical protein
VVVASIPPSSHGQCHCSSFSFYMRLYGTAYNKGCAFPVHFADFNIIPYNDLLMAFSEGLQER